MADFDILVGAQAEASFTDLVNDINQLFAKVNKPLEIKVKVSDKAAITDLQKQISQINATSKTGSSSSYMQGIANGAKAANSQISATKAHLNSVNAALKEINATNSTITSSYKNLSKALGGSSATGQNATELSAMKSKYLELQTAVESLRTSKASATQEDINNIYRLQSEMQNLMNTTQQRITTEREAAAAAEQTAKAEAAAVKQAAQAQKEKAAATADAERTEKKYYSTINQLNSALRNYSAAETSRNASSRTAYTAINSTKQALEQCFVEYQSGSKSLDAFKQSIASANTTLASSTATIKANGDATKTLGDRVGGLVSKFTSWLTISQAVMLAVNSIRQMVSASIELDSAMTELKKVTDETDATYARFLDNASARATKIGTSLSDIVSATADFARLGYNIDDASELADAASIYLNVGDDLDGIDDASQSIISTLQAFYSGADNQAELAMSIVDKFNEVSEFCCSTVQ